MTAKLRNPTALRRITACMDNGMVKETREAEVSEAAFAQWLRESLRREYAGVQHERVPDWLLSLVDTQSARPAVRRS